VLFEPDVVLGLRSFKGRRVVAGYFEDYTLLADEAARWTRVNNPAWSKRPCRRKRSRRFR
jgi:hypothetical protein